MNRTNPGEGIRLLAHMVRELRRWFCAFAGALIVSWLLADAFLRSHGRGTFVTGWVVLYLLAFGAIWWMLGLYVSDE